MENDRGKEINTTAAGVYKHFKTKEINTTLTNKQNVLRQQEYC